MLAAAELTNLFSVEALIALLTLTSLEIVLGIDNIVFIAILTGRLNPAQRSKARRLGLLGAMVMRILLLLTIGWMMKLTTELFTLAEHGFSGKDLILIGGGLFLLAKATYEIHHRIEAPGASGDTVISRRAGSFQAAILQIMLLDIVFSLDSVITAVGMARHIEVMIAAVVVSVIVMMIFANPISEFIERHPTFKMLALSFLLLIGMTLMVDGLGGHIHKGYIYFAMGFSLFVEVLNLRASRRGATNPASA